jgi:hypothetical protein
MDWAPWTGAASLPLIGFLVWYLLPRIRRWCPTPTSVAGFRPNIPVQLRSPGSGSPGSPGTLQELSPRTGTIGSFEETTQSPTTTPTRLPPNNRRFSQVN